MVSHSAFVLSGDIPFDHLRQLPSEVHCVMHTGLDALSTVRGMHMCSIAGQQNPPVTVGRRVMSVNLEIQVGLWTPNRSRMR